MFKSVAQSLKIANKLRDDPKRLEAERKSSKKWLDRLDRLASGAATESQDKIERGEKEPVPVIDGLRHKDEGFLVRQSKKKFSKFVTRLQNVKRMSAMQMKRQPDEGEKKKKKNSAKSIKDKVVKFRLPNSHASDDDQLGSEFDDSDDDDAYVSASDTFDDEYEFDEAIGVHCEQGGSNADDKKGETSKRFVEDPGDKLILPEELCDIPSFRNTQNCSREIIDETRRLLIERYENNPESFYESDYQRMLADDWTVTRFLLRRRQDPRRTAKLMEECGKFRRDYRMGEVQLRDFPTEFHIPGGLFKYEPDLVGNVTMYMRIKMYRRVPEISDVFKAFILCVLEQCDVQCDGRGTAVVFDLSGCGLQNVDLGFLYWLLNSFRNYCPKGVSYILVYNLPWFLSATAKLAMTWMSETNRRSLRFVQGKEIENFIARENLPDYLGGTCPKEYKQIPDGALPAVETCEELGITRAQALKIRELFKEYLPEDYDKVPVASGRSNASDSNNNTSNSSNNTNTNTNTNTNNNNNNNIRSFNNGEQPNSTGDQSDNESRGSSSASTLAAAPVVQLVSKASKFMATN